MSVQLRRPLAVGLDLLVQARRLRVSNRTDHQAGTIAAQTALRLEELGYAHVLEVVAVPTDAGRQLIESGDIEIPERRYEHGTYACYVLGACRCQRCRDANAAYERNRVRANAYGRPLSVDAEPVRAHVRELMCEAKRGANRMGVGLKQIAKVSGVSHGALWKLMYGAPDRDGPSKTVRRETAEKLLAVSMADMADGACVPAASTWKRVNEMVRAGWSKAAIARHVHGPQAKALQLGKEWITAGNARKVAQLHAAWQAGEISTQREQSRWHQTKEADRAHT